MKKTKTKTTPVVKFGKLTPGKHQEFKEGTAKKPAPHKGGKVVDNPKKPSPLFASKGSK